ncbi:MAG TPA: acyltransferase [Solirubrobacteraceae bacterium]|nr:acyltransferase [Solirubrobacteraceae bacterium]
MPYRGVDLLADRLVAPLVASYAIKRRLIGDERAYLECSERASRWTGLAGERMRRALHNRLGTPVGEGAILRFGCILERPPVEIGRYTVIGHYANVQHARIGDDCLVSDFVYIIDGPHQHNFDRVDVPMREQGITIKQVSIGRDTWIGGHAMILADVGEYCIVGAGSVVTKPVPDYQIVVGNPARVIGDRRDRGGPGLAGP